MEDEGGLGAAWGYVGGPLSLPWLGGLEGVEWADFGVGLRILGLWFWDVWMRLWRRGGGGLGGSGCL